MQKLVQYSSFLKGGTNPENVVDEINRSLASGYEIVSITNTSFPPEDGKEGILTQVVLSKRDGMKLTQRASVDKDEFIRASENIDMTGKAAMSDFSFEKLLTT